MVIYVMQNVLKFWPSFASKKNVMAGQIWHRLFRMKSYLPTNRDLLSFVCSLALGTSFAWSERVTPVPTGNLSLVLSSSFVLKKGREQAKSSLSCEPLQTSWSLHCMHFILLQASLMRLTKSFLIQSLVIYDILALA